MCHFLALKVARAIVLHLDLISEVASVSIELGHRWKCDEYGIGASSLTARPK